ncbi:GMC family oxidoreductase [Sinorhizobium medicae]|uniref:GMC family oxidoreductase n=1 Tax=Sinorhizobium medicae TaxID=110321 RepID=UPI000FDC2FFC|nr:GMC family oxidoreductase N-terminal domain-containing protein [Sinorhizobium medicae]RVO73536.1 choline dehydrogenase [Sinorhizobium medicae]
MQTYDFIVVGSGSGGGPVAARLSESGQYRVLCLEAGSQGAGYIWSRSPLGGAFMIQNPKVNWCDRSMPNASTGHRPIYVPHGKILGGSSAINGTIFNRGQAQDYQTWAQLGCRGWSYSDVLPFFKRLESSPVGSDQSRGRSGPIRVTELTCAAPLQDLLMRSAEAFGLPANPDYNGSNQWGVAMAQQATLRGKRQSTATRYLMPAAKRPNLTILRGAHATSLIIEDKRCVGLRFIHDGVPKEARAAREVIVSCGTINSPKLLELSGIGNPAILSRHGIPVVCDLPGVGENLQDHYAATMAWTLTRPGIGLADHGRGIKFLRELIRYTLFGTGFMGQGLGSVQIFAKSRVDIDDADLQIIAIPYLIEIKDGKRKMARRDAFMLICQGQRPESTGSVHIQSSDVLQPPAIAYNVLMTDGDRTAAVAAFRTARAIVGTAPLAGVVGEEIMPGSNVETDEQILDYYRNAGATTYHAVGTCKMGIDAQAVVDERLRVRGIEGLRIADASVMPRIVSGNTSIPTMMIGEKCASMIITDAA